MASQLFHHLVLYLKYKLVLARWWRDLSSTVMLMAQRLHGGPVRLCSGVPLVERLVALHWTANQHPRSVLTLRINPLCSADMPSSFQGTTKPKDRALRLGIHCPLIEGGRKPKG